MNKLLEKLKCPVSHLVELEKEYRKGVASTQTQLARLSKHLGKTEKEVALWLEYRHIYELYKVNGIEQAVAEKFEKTRFLLELEDLSVIPTMPAHRVNDEWFDNAQLIELLLRMHMPDAVVNLVPPPSPPERITNDCSAGRNEVNHFSDVTSSSAIQNLGTAASQVDPPATVSFLPVISSTPTTSSEIKHSSVSSTSPIVYNLINAHEKKQSKKVDLAHSTDVLQSDENVSVSPAEAIEISTDWSYPYVNEPQTKLTENNNVVPHDDDTIKSERNESVSLPEVNEIDNFLINENSNGSVILDDDNWEYSDLQCPLFEY